MTRLARYCHWPTRGLAGWSLLLSMPAAAAPLVLPQSLLDDDVVTFMPASIVQGTGGTRVIAQKCHNRVRQGCRGASVVAPVVVAEAVLAPVVEAQGEQVATETLAQALAAAYDTAPALQARRYLVRANDQDYALALAELRPTSELQVTGAYQKTVPGRVTAATRFGGSPIITTNTLTAQALVSQPLYTGGKAAADRDAARAEIRAGREQLRGTEGDVLLQVITAYADVRRDTAVLRLYTAHIVQLQATLNEVKARREAGELTRTDIAQAETQLDQALTSTNSAAQQLDQDRAAFAAYVGHDPGVLAPPPPLPHIPGSVGEAFAAAEDQSPEMAAAMETERESRAKIAAAQAQGRATVTLTGTAQLTGGAYPFYLHNQDQVFAGQAVLTIPLTNGGRVGALVAQAQDNNAADRIGIEAARRQMVDTVINAWNGIATAQRNITVATSALASARTFDDGTFQEYRAGLRSTFDVLYAHSTLLNAQVALVADQHDLYVAGATLLRRIGVLEARALMTGTGLYDAGADLRQAEARGSLPGDGVVRAIDRMARTTPVQPGLQQPPLGSDAPAIVPAPATLPLAEPAQTSPNIPVPGTTGTPIPDRSLARP